MHDILHYLHFSFVRIGELPLFKSGSSAYASIAMIEMIKIMEAYEFHKIKTCCKKISLFVGRMHNFWRSDEHFI